MNHSQNIKAVVFYAEADFGKKFADGLYQHLIEELKKNLHTFNIPLIHLTVSGQEGYGDENYFYDVDNVNHVIYNREKIIVDFLKQDAKDDEVYWFCEPDFRLFKEFPPLTTDVCMLYRQDSVAMTPAWRLAKKSALPFFEEAFSYFDYSQMEWDGDSPAWIKMHEILGRPEVGFTTHKGITIELREYIRYASRRKYIYSGQWKGGSKIEIVNDEFKKKLQAVV